MYLPSGGKEQVSPLVVQGDKLDCRKGFVNCFPKAVQLFDMASQGNNENIIYIASLTDLYSLTK